MLVLGGLASGCGETSYIPLVDDGSEARLVTVSAWGEGRGLIRAAPYVECWYENGTTRGTCEAELPAGTSLSLHALPADTALNGVAFERWAGACSGLETTCHVTVGDFHLNVSAGFTGVTRLHGRLVPAQAVAYDLADLGVTMTVDDSVRGRIPVRSDGTFDATLRGSVSSARDVDVVVDRRTEAPRQFFPAFVHLKPWELADSLKLVLVPRQWTLAAGTHRGVTREVVLAEALVAQPSFYMATGQSLAAKNWQYQVQTVTADRLPLSLTVDRAGSTAQVDDVDVERYWRRIAELEAAVGRDLFTPAGSPASADVIVAVRPGSCGRATACAQIVSGNPYLLEGGRVFHQSVEQFRADRGVVAHELTHILGMGHTCGWPSLMFLGPEECGGADQASLLPSPLDLVYLDLAITVNSLQRAQSMPAFGGGLVAAWNGQRVVLEGRSPWQPAGCTNCGGATHR